MMPRSIAFFVSFTPTCVPCISRCGGALSWILPFKQPVPRCARGRRPHHSDDHASGREGRAAARIASAATRTHVPARRSDAVPQLRRSRRRSGARAGADHELGLSAHRSRRRLDAARTEADRASGRFRQRVHRRKRVAHGRADHQRGRGQRGAGRRVHAGGDSVLEQTRAAAGRLLSPPSREPRAVDEGSAERRQLQKDGRPDRRIARRAQGARTAAAVRHEGADVRPVHDAAAGARTRRAQSGTV